MTGTVVIDTSVFVAILLREPEADDLSARVRIYSDRLMTAASYLECALVLSRWKDSRSELDDWLAREAITIADINHAVAQRAADAFLRFGKGRHPAGLNFGDCFSYALAKSLNAPLLFKGNDFARTDVTPAVS